MKIKEILGEEAAMVVKDFKPGQSLSMVDPATDTMTTVDLKKNPAALKTNDQGEFMFDPTPDSGAPGEPKQPEIKPGAQIKVDTAAAEGRMSEIDMELQNIANSGDEEELIDALGGLKGGAVADTLEDMIEDLADELSAKGMNNIINDQDKMIELLMDKLVKEYGEDDLPFEPDDDVSDKDQFGNTIKNKARHLARKGMNAVMGRKEGMAPGTALDVKNERMDESAVITALARRVAGTEVKTQTKSKEVFDIKKLAGL